MNKYNFTEKDEKYQELVNFKKIILNNLPENLEQTARQYGAVKRSREVKSAVGLLQMLLFYACTNISIKLLSITAAQLGIARITDTAWRKQIKTSVEWLRELLKYCVGNILPRGDQNFSNKRTVYAIDGSTINTTGTKNKNLRIHMCYNLSAGCMHEVKVSDYHTAESFSHFTMNRGDIYIADACYGRAAIFEYALSKEADVILRLTPNNVVLVNKDGEKINIYQILRKTKKTTLDIKCYIKNNKNLIPIRVILNRIPEEKQEQAIKRKKRISQKKQSKIKPETLEYAKWVVLGTSLDKSHQVAEILKMYFSRWQIELLFKRFKQNLKISTIRKGSENYAIAIVHLWLIIWSIVEKEAISMELKLIRDGNSINSINKWNLCSYAYLIISFSIIADRFLTCDFFDTSFIEKYLLVKPRNDRLYQFADTKLFLLNLCCFSFKIA